MAILLLCYKGDEVASKALAKLTSADVLDGRCRSEFDDVVEEPFGVFKVGSIACSAAEKKTQRVVLGYLEYGVGIQRAIDKTGHRFSDAVLIATAHRTQVEFMERAGRDLKQGYAVFQNERPPLADVPNALLITSGEHHGQLWIAQLAGIVLRNFVFPGLETAEEASARAEATARVEHELPQVG
jgi:hypothetical protein